MLTQKHFVKIFYHDLYVQSNTLLLADVFENFRNICFKYMNLILKNFFSSWIALQAAFKKTKIKLDSLTDINMVLMVQKDIRRGISYSIYQYAKVNSKYIKNYNKNKELSYIRCWSVNNLYG